MIALEWNTHTATVNCRSISYAQENGQRCLKERHKSPIIAPQSWQLEKLQHLLFIWFDSIQGLFFYIFSHRRLPCLVVETLVTGSNFPPVRLRSATVVRPVMDNSQQTGRKNGPYQKHKNTQKRIKSLLLLKPVSSLPDMCCVCGCITFQAADPFVCNSCCCCCCRQSPCFSIYLGVVIIPKTFCVFLCLTLGEPLCLFFIF
jgi:hypothetical protein